jgi:cobalt/nickel transport system permease protein
VDPRSPPAAVVADGNIDLTVGGGLHRPLYVRRASPVHALAPECKIVATVAFVFAVVATPRDAIWAFGLYAAIVAGLAWLAQIPVSVFARRLAIELPFVAFAVLLPIVGTGPHTEVLGVSLSVPGLWGAWNILMKGTLGVAATGILVTTTDVRDLLQGLDRLHVPKAFTAITSFMIRYAEVVAGELRAMRIARVSRGHDPRWIWQARAVAATAGTLFIRSYERGERVYLAMASRGYGNEVPTTTVRAPVSDWLLAFSVPVIAAVVVVVASWT